MKLYLDLVSSHGPVSECSPAWSSRGPWSRSFSRAEARSFAEGLEGFGGVHASSLQQVNGRRADLGDEQGGDARLGPEHDAAPHQQRSGHRQGYCDPGLHGPGAYREHDQVRNRKPNGHPEELPHFVQWTMTGEGTYAVGLEPATCRVGGYQKAE
jgi:hypothetical protein